MTTQLRVPDHRCSLPTPNEGEIRRCDECGRTWIGRRPRNPDYWAWHQLTWLGRKLRHLP